MWFNALVLVVLNLVVVTICHLGHNPGNAHGEDPKVFDRDSVHDREHIKEHLQGMVEETDTSKMSEQELQFHYFKMHDNDNNNKLDGLELVKSIIHWHMQEGNQQQVPGAQQAAPPKIFVDSELTMLIDPILISDDANRDGFIDYMEFVSAQSRMSQPPPR